MTETEKVVVITGCSSGFGMATAALVAKEEGYKVIATMRNLEKKADLEKAAGESLNKTLFIKELDVSKEESIMQFLKEIYNCEGRIDVLVNNAGVAAFGAFEHFTRYQSESLFQTNFFGPLRLTQEVVHDMKKRRSGKIIFVSSILGVIPIPGHDLYCASKHAIEGFTGSIAPILRQFNISVTSVQAGPAYTNICANVKVNDLGVGNLLADEFYEDTRADAETNTCLRKLWETAGAHLRKVMLQKEEVAHVIKKCIEDEWPPIKVQTDASSEAAVVDTLKDPTGSQTNDKYMAYMQ